MKTIFSCLLAISCCIGTGHGFFFTPAHSYTQLIEQIRVGDVEKVIVRNDLKEATLIEKNGHQQRMHVDPMLTTQLLKEASDHWVEIKVEEQLALPEWFIQTVITVPLFLFGWNLFQRMFPDFRQYEFEQLEQTNLTFQDWGGSREIIQECKGMVQLFHTNQTTRRKPKGILLEGPPGTGKTMLGKIIAHHVNSSFLVYPATNFVELYVGMGALRVRKLFEYARQHRPCIIFMDEIDAIGQKRRQSMVGNEEREQTLNQLLYEMDGFQDNDGLLIMAATNRKDVLDEALLRPGRFDKVLHIPLPDAPSRLEIVQLFLRNKTVEQGIDWGFFMSQTEGFSGADLEQWVDEALERGDDQITTDSLWEALERLQVGVKKDRDLRPEAIRRKVAIHEAGHTLLCLCFSDYFVFQKVSIQETYSGVGGYTLYNIAPEVDNLLMTKDLLMKQVQLLLGGRIAESVFYGDDHVSIGAHDDLDKANELCRQMVSQFGMGLKLNNVVSSEQDPFSEQFQTMMDYDSVVLLRSAMTNTRRLVQHHKAFIEQLADELLFDVSLSAKEVETMWQPFQDKDKIVFL